MASKIQIELCEEFAHEAAFLWTLRSRAVHGYRYDLARLTELDERIEAHLDGLRLLGECGWEACRAVLDEEEPGGFFAAGVIALGKPNREAFAEVLEAAGEERGPARELISACGWTPSENLGGVLGELLSPKASAAEMRLGIGACAVHRRDPGIALGYALAHPSARVRARALRAVGELGRVDLIAELIAAFEDKDGDCRFWSSWSAALFGNVAAVPYLQKVAVESGGFAERAADMVVRRLEVGVARRWIETTVLDSARPRVVFVAAAALGDPGLLPLVLDCMASPELARIAGWAWSHVTGVDLVGAKLCQEPPADLRSRPSDDSSDDDVAMDPVDALPWPDARRVSEWWLAKRGDFSAGTRYLLGRPITVDWLETVLRRGKQVAREAAAIELSVLHLGRPLFEVRARQGEQRRVKC